MTTKRTKNFAVINDQDLTWTMAIDEDFFVSLTSRRRPTKENKASTKVSLLLFLMSHFLINHFAKREKEKFFGSAMINKDNALTMIKQKVLLTLEMISHLISTLRRWIIKSLEGRKGKYFPFKRFFSSRYQFSFDRKYSDRKNFIFSAWKNFTLWPVTRKNYLSLNNSWRFLQMFFSTFFYLFILKQRKTLFRFLVQRSAWVQSITVCFYDPFSMQKFLIFS